MNIKRSTIAFGCLVLSLLISSCGPGQVFGPTLTATPTNTVTPTWTPRPTLTFTPTLTSTVTPTLTPTVTSTATPTSTPTVSTNCSLLDVSPVAGAEVPSYKYRGEGFAPNDSVAVTLTGTVEGDTSIEMWCNESNYTNAQGQVEGVITWCLWGNWSAEMWPAEMIPSIGPGIFSIEKTGCTASQTVTWP